jgi:hypothetical protein
MALRISRRTAIAGGAAGIAVAAAGATIVLPSQIDFARLLLGRAIGAFDMPDKELALLLEAFHRQRELAYGLKADLWGVATRLGARALLPRSHREALEDQQRRLLAFFMLSTDYLDPERKGAVAYLDRGEACTSPFARLA